VGFFRVRAHAYQQRFEAGGPREAGEIAVSIDAIRYSTGNSEALIWKGLDH